jgi:hypothetical protein
MSSDPIAPSTFYTGPTKASWNPKAKMTSTVKGFFFNKILPTANAVIAPTQKEGFSKAPTAADLFPKTDPTIDGEECIRDCESCSVKYPKTFKIDEEEELYGFIKGWSRHILCATGKTDWVRDVADEKGSIMEAVGKHNGLHEGVCRQPQRLLFSHADSCTIETYALSFKHPSP